MDCQTVGGLGVDGGLGAGSGMTSGRQPDHRRPGVEAMPGEARVVRRPGVEAMPGEARVVRGEVRVACGTPRRAAYHPLR